MADTDPSHSTLLHPLSKAEQFDIEQERDTYEAMSIAFSEAVYDNKLGEFRNDKERFRDAMKVFLKQAPLDLKTTMCENFGTHLKKIGLNCPLKTQTEAA